MTLTDEQPDVHPPRNGRRGRIVLYVLASLVAAAACYISWLVFDGYQADRDQDDVLAQVEQALLNQLSTARSTECSRGLNAEVVAAGAEADAVQLETIAVSLTARLETAQTGVVSAATVQEAEDLRPRIEAAQARSAAAGAAYEQVNERCPLPTG